MNRVLSSNQVTEGVVCEEISRRTKICNFLVYKVLR